MNPLGAGVADHVLDQRHRRAGPAHARRRFGMVGADQRWTSNGEAELGFAVDAVDPADIAPARPGYPLFDADRAGHSALHCKQLHRSAHGRDGRQRREFVAVVGRKVEQAAAPVGLAPLILGGFDPVLARRDEVPPDVAGPSERRAAEDDEARAGGTGRDADPVPGSKHHHPAGLERLARDRDRALDDVEAAILVIVGERQARAGLEIGVCVEGLGEDPDRRGFAIGPSEDQPDAHAVALDDGEGLLAMMLEARLSVLLGLWQRDPGLDAEHAVRRLAGGCARPLGVGDAAPRHHPVYRARQDDLVRAQAVAVLELAAKEVGDGREADMGMRADVDALA